MQNFAPCATITCDDVRKKALCKTHYFSSDRTFCATTRETVRQICPQERGRAQRVIVWRFVSLHWPAFLLRLDGSRFDGESAAQEPPSVGELRGRPGRIVRHVCPRDVRARPTAWQYRHSWR